MRERRAGRGAILRVRFFSMVSQTVRALWIASGVIAGQDFDHHRTDGYQSSS